MTNSNVYTAEQGLQITDLIIKGFSKEEAIKTVMIKELRKKLKELDKSITAVGWKTPEGKKFNLESIRLRREFRDIFGDVALKEVLIGKSSNFARLHNSKGNGYGNM